MFNFILGCIICIVVVFIYNKLKSEKKLNAKNVTLLAGAALAFLIAALWVSTSIGEDEIQAAMVGLLIFGGIATILSVLLYRVAFNTNKIVLTTNSNKSIQN